LYLNYMKFIQGHNRTQINLFPVSLDQSIDPDNEVRIIDLFVDSLSIKDYGFRMDFVENGRPAYHPADLLKLFIYGYMNKIRTTRALAESDEENQRIIQEEIKKQQERKAGYQDLETKLKESGETQISLTDPESRQIVIRNNITEVAYNIQTTNDAKHNIPIDYKVTNENDSKAMGNMVQRAKSILRTTDFTVLYDKGFHTGSELKTAQDLGIETIVAVPAVSSTSQAPNHDYNYEHFIYNKEADTYTCPQGQVLRTNGSWYKQLSSSGSISWFKQYKTKACRKCPARSQCTRSQKERLIQRSEYADYYERNRKNTLEKEKLYKRRQAIVEHPYGTLKRQWGFSYILTKKGMNRASSDVGLMFIAYNLRRIGNILTPEVLKEYLKVLVSLIFPIIPLLRVTMMSFRRPDDFIPIYVDCKIMVRKNT
jgi:hypothetical protein